MNVKVFFGVWQDKVLNAKVTTKPVIQSVSSGSQQGMCPKFGLAGKLVKHVALMSEPVSL